MGNFVCNGSDAKQVLFFLKHVLIPLYDVRHGGFPWEGACVASSDLNLEKKNGYRILSNVEDEFKRTDCEELFQDVWAVCLGLRRGRTLVVDDEHPPMSSSALEMFERRLAKIYGDRHHLFPWWSQCARGGGLGHGSCHRVAEEDLMTRGVASKFVSIFLTSDQK